MVPSSPVIADLTEPAARHLDGKFGNDAEANVVLVREALRAAVGELPCRSEVETLKATLLSLSIDAEIVLDVHCDSIATMHLYAHSSQEDTVMMLAADLDSPVVLLEDEPGGDPFDKCNQAPWIGLRERFELDQTLPIRCFSTTVELRGCNDVNDSMARADAEGLLHFLMRQGVVSGAPPPLGKPSCQPESDPDGGAGSPSAASRSASITAGSSLLSSRIRRYYFDSLAFGRV